MLSRWFKKRKSKRKSSMVNHDYALLYHKVSRRLGHARARARQAENEADYLADQLTEMRLELASEAEKLARHLSQNARTKADLLEQRDRDRAELLQKHAETIVAQQERIKALEDRLLECGYKNGRIIPENGQPGF